MKILACGIEPLKNNVEWVEKKKKNNFASQKVSGAGKKIKDRKEAINSECG